LGRSLELTIGIEFRFCPLRLPDHKQAISKKEKAIYQNEWIVEIVQANDKKTQTHQTKNPSKN